MLPAVAARQPGIKDRWQGVAQRLRALFGWRIRLRAVRGGLLARVGLVLAGSAVLVVGVSRCRRLGIGRGLRFGLWGWRRRILLGRCDGLRIPVGGLVTRACGPTPLQPPRRLLDPLRVHLYFDRFPKLVTRPAQLKEQLPYRACELGQILGAEEEQDDCHDGQDFPEADSEHRRSPAASGRARGATRRGGPTAPWAPRRLRGLQRAARERRSWRGRSSSLWGTLSGGSRRASESPGHTIRVGRGEPCRPAADLLGRGPHQEGEPSGATPAGSP